MNVRKKRIVMRGFLKLIKDTELNSRIKIVI